MNLKKATQADFEYIYSEMKKNFIPEELRDFEHARSVMDMPDYSVYHICDGDDRLGFITIWELCGFAFAEHFVICEKYRNKGYGRKALSLIKEKYDKIVLEVEHPTDEMKCRRIGFYERNEFCRNEFPYIQPSYRECGEGVPLILMSYPEKIIDCNSTVKQIYTRVYGKMF